MEESRPRKNPFQVRRVNHKFANSTVEARGSEGRRIAVAAGQKAAKDAEIVHQHKVDAVQQGLGLPLTGLPLSRNQEQSPLRWSVTMDQNPTIDDVVPSGHVHVAQQGLPLPEPELTTSRDQKGQSPASQTDDFSRRGPLGRYVHRAGISGGDAERAEVLLSSLQENVASSSHPASTDGFGHASRSAPLERPSLMDGTFRVSISAPTAPSSLQSSLPDSKLSGARPTATRSRSSSQPALGSGNFRALYPPRRLLDWRSTSVRHPDWRRDLLEHDQGDNAVARPSVIQQQQLLFADCAVQGNVRENGTAVDAKLVHEHTAAGSTLTHVWTVVTHLRHAVKVLYAITVILGLATTMLAYMPSVRCIGTGWHCPPSSINLTRGEWRSNATGEIEVVWEEFGVAVAKLHGSKLHDSEAARAGARAQEVFNLSLIAYDLKQLCDQAEKARELGNIMVWGVGREAVAETNPAEARPSFTLAQRYTGWSSSWLVRQIMRAEDALVVAAPQSWTDKLYRTHAFALWAERVEQAIQCITADEHSQAAMCPMVVEKLGQVSHEAQMLSAWMHAVGMVQWWRRDGAGGGAEEDVVSEVARTAKAALDASVKECDMLWMEESLLPDNVVGEAVGAWWAGNAADVMAWAARVEGRLLFADGPGGSCAFRDALLVGIDDRDDHDDRDGRDGRAGRGTGWARWTRWT